MHMQPEGADWRRQSTMQESDARRGYCLYDRNRGTSLACLPLVINWADVQGANFNSATSLTSEEMWAMGKSSERDYRYRYQYAHDVTGLGFGLTVKQPPGNHNKLIL